MILFVDVNDVCRAPLAAALYRRIHGAQAHSAGVYTDEGACLCDAVRPALLDGHTARQLSEAMLEKADAVWCVTAAIARHLEEDSPQFAHKIHAMQEVPDPTGMGRKAYEACEQQLRAQVEGMA